MQRFSSDIEVSWFWYFRCLLEPSIRTVEKVPIKDIIRWNVIKYLFEIQEIKNWGLNKNLWWTGHFDLVIVSNDENEPLHCYEINGAGHNDKNDFAKFVFCLFDGIQLSFADKFPEPVKDWQQEWIDKQHPKSPNYIANQLGITVEYFLKRYGDMYDEAMKERQSYNDNKQLIAECKQNRSQQTTDMKELLYNAIKYNKADLFKDKIIEHIYDSFLE